MPGGVFPIIAPAYGPSPTLWNEPGPMEINAPNSPYRFGPVFLGEFAQRTQTVPFHNYLFDQVNGMQKELQNAAGNSYYPLPPWPQQNGQNTYVVPSTGTQTVGYSGQPQYGYTADPNSAAQLGYQNYAYAGQSQPGAQYVTQGYYGYG